MGDKNCFVIMPFSDREAPADNRWNDLYDHCIRPAVEAAGYRCYRSLNPPGSFMHDVVKHLATDEVVIAVLTKLRPNVLYELGARSALKGRTIMLIEKGSHIPSDLNAYIALRYSMGTTASREAVMTTIRERLAQLDAERPTSDNPIHDNLVQAAGQLVKEWFESENPRAFRPRLEKVLPDYVLMLEHVWRKIGAPVDRPREAAASVQPFDRTRARAAARQAAMIWTNRGTELKDKHEFEAALRCFDVALELDPDNVTALSNRSLVLIMLQRYEEAEQSARLVTDSTPATADAWNARGKALLAERNFAGSAVAFKRAFELDPMSAIYANNAGFALELSGEEEEALVYYERSLVLNPDFPHALYNRGKLLRKLGREQEGMASIERALEIDSLIGEEVESQRHALATENPDSPTR